MSLLSLCGPRHHPLPPVLPTEVADARKGHDPTRTWRLRARMRAEGDRRWQALARTLRQALIEHDLVGLRGMSKLPHGDKTEGFAIWLREELRQKVLGYDGRWLKPYVQQAADMAQQRAASLLPVHDAFDPDEPRDPHGQWTSEGNTVREKFLNEFGQRYLHGTLRENVSSIKATGLQPMAGPFVEQAYSEEYEEIGEKLPELVYLSSEDDQERAFNAIRAQIAAKLYKQYRDVTYRDVKEHGALIVARSTDLHHVGKFEQSEQARTAEPGDWYSFEPVSATGVMTGTRLVAFMKKYAAIKMRDARLRDAAVDSSRVIAMQALAVNELRGISAAAEQQIVRAVTHCLMANATPYRTAGAVAKCIRVMRNRTRAMAEHIVAKTHATSTLSAFRSVGVTHVGVDPERLRKPRIVQTAHGKVLKDADVDLDVLWVRTKALVEKAEINRDYDVIELANRNRDGSVVYIDKDVPKVLKDTGIKPDQTLPWHELSELQLMDKGWSYPAAHKVATKIEKRRVEQLKPGAWDDYQEEMGGLIADAEERGYGHEPPKQDKRVFDARMLDRDVEEGEDVDVITAGDNDVCPICEEISDNGPYELDEAEDLIPAHPFCRCGFVPLSDRRFASVHEFDFDPNQPREASAPGHSSGEFAAWGGASHGEEVSPKQAAKVKELAERTPGLKAMLAYMTPDEINKVRPANVAKLVSAFENFPGGAEEMAAVAYSGSEKRGWYHKSAQTIVDVFGAVDAPRFAAMMAGMSPQTSVMSNAVNALCMWKNWIKAGRPTDKDKIVHLLGKSVQGEKGEGSVLPAWIPNTVSALTTKDPENLKLSGPKVDSFALNLRDHVNAVTLDTWMANYAALDADVFRKVGNAPGKGPFYTAASAVTRQAAEYLSKHTGDKWTPAEIQETVWSWARTLYTRASKEGTTVSALLNAGGVTHADIKDTPDFAILFTQGVYRKILEESGYAKQIAASGGRPDQGHGRGGSLLAAEGSGIAQDAFTRFLNHAAKRLDEVRARRKEERAEDGLTDFNPYHEPAGSPEGGRFATTGFEGSSAAMGEAELTKYTHEVDALREGTARISWEQRQALDMYTNNSALFNSNRDRPGVRSREADTLDNLIKQSTIPRDLVVYRRVDWSGWNEKLTAQVGKDFTEPNFMSTTLDPGLKRKPGSYMEIHIPKGAAGLPVGSLSSYPEEAEVLFPRGSRMRVESATPLSAPNSVKFVARLQRAN